MKTLLILFLLSSCATYTDPEQEKLTYYQCEKGHEIVSKHSDDYQMIRLKVGQEQMLMHYFVTEQGEGYRTENYLFLTKGKKAKLMHKNRDGSEVVVLNDCKTEKVSLKP